MSGVFEAVKDAVTARQAAEAYGIRVYRSGMACCPFHRDRKPSMKVDRRFHCFGCGADGDVVNFTARLFGLGNKEAAEKLAADFGISYEKWKPPDRKKQRQAEKQANRNVRFEEAQRKFYCILTDYYHMLWRWKEERAPKSPDEDWDEYFCEALRNTTGVEYLIDSFLTADLEEKIDIMNDYGEKVKEFEERIGQYRSEEAGRPGKDDGSLRGDSGR